MLVESVVAMNETPQKNQAAVTLGRMAAGVPKTVTTARQEQLAEQARKMTENRMAVAKAVGQKVAIARGVPSKILIPQRPEIIRPGAGLV